MPKIEESQFDLLYVVHGVKGFVFMNELSMQSDDVFVGLYFKHRSRLRRFPPGLESMSEKCFIDNIRQIRRGPDQHEFNAVRLQ
jgi:hypothetical protein